MNALIVGSILNFVGAYLHLPSNCSINRHIFLYDVDAYSCEFFSNYSAYDPLTAQGRSHMPKFILPQTVKPGPGLSSAYSSNWDILNASLPIEQKLKNAAMNLESRGGQLIFTFNPTGILYDLSLPHFKDFFWIQTIDAWNVSTINLDCSQNTMNECYMALDNIYLHLTPQANLSFWLTIPPWNETFILEYIIRNQIQVSVINLFINQPSADIDSLIPIIVDFNRMLINKQIDCELGVTIDMWQYFNVNETMAYVEMAIQSIADVTYLGLRGASGNLTNNSTFPIYYNGLMFC